MAIPLQQKQQQQGNMVPGLAPVGTGCCSKQLTAPSLIQTMVPRPPIMLNAPESELTCNLPGSRKRSGEEVQPPIMPLTSSSLSQQQLQQALLHKSLLLNQMGSQTHQEEPLMETSRPNESAMASCSSRPHLATHEPSIASHGHNINSTKLGSSSFGQALNLHTHSSLALQIDALVSHHTDTLRSELKQSYKRHWRARLSSMQQQVNCRVAMLQAELDAAVNRKTELEDCLKKALAGSHAWYSAAKTSEATVLHLRASLENALLRKLNDGNNDTEHDNADKCAAGDNLSGVAVVGEEGYGDSAEEAVSAAAAAPAAVSRSVRWVDSGKHSVGAGCSLVCRSCSKQDACVLLLPCRHLCFCRSCEPAFEVCPVCHIRKNACLQINLP